MTVVALLAAGVGAVVGGAALGLWRRVHTRVVLAHLVRLTIVFALTCDGAALMAREWAATGGAAAGAVDDLARVDDRASVVVIALSGVRFNLHRNTLWSMDRQGQSVKVLSSMYGIVRTVHWWYFSLQTFLPHWSEKSGKYAVAQSTGAPLTHLPYRSQCSSPLQ